MVPVVESLLVLINSYADAADEHRVQQAVDALRADADVQVFRTAMPGDLDGALQRRGGRTVVVVGGDRYLHTVVAALHRRNELGDTLLATLPDGSDAAFADAIGIPFEPDVAAKEVLGGVERRFDLLVDCRGSVVVNGVRLGRCRHGRESVGPTALGDHGPMPALDHAGRRSKAPRSKPLHVRIEADDTVVADFDRPVLEVAVNNSPLPGTAPGGMSPFGVPGPDGTPRLAPGADPSDGLADVVVSFAVGVVSGARRLLRRPTPFAREDVLSLRARQVRVVGQRFWMSCDGHDGGTEQRCTWRVVPRSLRMIVPAAATG